MNWKDKVAMSMAPMILLGIALLAVAGGGVIIKMASVADTRMQRQSPAFATAEHR